MRVFITGGTGLVGSRLIPQLRQRGDEPVVLSRRSGNRFGDGVEMVQGDPTQRGPWQDRATACDAIINLAGEGIFNKRWSPEFKQILRDSRVQATTHCAEVITRQPKQADGSPKVLINASAIGYYGAHGDEELDESAAPGDDFLASICVEWEKAAEAAAGARVVLARIGIVLDKNGGALAKLLTPFKLGMGGPVASGKQYMSWIHLDDVVGLLLFALDTQALVGPMNVTAPQPLTNKEFGKALGKALGRPAFMWTPGFMLHAMLGERADLIINGSKVVPHKALSLGYRFKFPGLDAALADVLK